MGHLVIKLNFIAAGSVLKVKYESGCLTHIHAQASSYCKEVRLHKGHRDLMPISRCI